MARLLSCVAVGLVVGVVAIACTRGAPTSAPLPSPSPVEPTPQPATFQVKLLRVKALSVANDPLFGDASPDAPAATQTAAEEAAKTLQAYLNAVFVEEATRFTAEPVEALLTKDAREALEPGDEQALGVGALHATGGQTGEAEAVARVMHSGDDVVGVTLRFDAAMRVVLPDGSQQPLSQRGQMLMVPTDEGWKADMVDVKLVTS